MEIQFAQYIGTIYMSNIGYLLKIIKMLCSSSMHKAILLYKYWNLWDRFDEESTIDLRPKSL